MNNQPDDPADDPKKDPLEVTPLEIASDEVDGEPVLEYSINYFFTLEEAAGMLPEIRKTLADAFDEVNEIKDEVILLRRMLTLRKDAGAKLSDEELASLRTKHQLLDDTVTNWVEHFLEKGIILRDMERGLLDFPYRPNDPKYHDEVFFLCWQYGEDGIFYFHAPEDGYAGRKPVAVLPD